MTAVNPQRRPITAKELAERLGCSPRTAQRLVAEPREQFLARAAQRRAQAWELRQAGLSYKQIAEQTGVIHESKLREHNRAGIR